EGNVLRDTAGSAQFGATVEEAPTPRIDTAAENLSDGGNSTTAPPSSHVGSGSDQEEVCREADEKQTNTSECTTDDEGPWHRALRLASQGAQDQGCRGQVP
ncbi:MAG: hypothetical protein ACKPKO_01965, partial [Candidatus Fonsibacter sp.]